MTKLIRPIVKLGNSAGVLLPKEWLKGEAKVELIRKPLDIKGDILGLLDKYLCDTKGIYLVGSYARDEIRKESDIDVLVVTNKITKKISKGKYNIILISEKNIEKTLKENVLPLLPMLKEAKSVINKSLIEKYINIPLTQENLKYHIETTKSSMRINKEYIELAQLEKENISDNMVYSLILRLREIYIVECLIKNKKPTTKEFLSLIRKITGSEAAYKAYLRVKENKKISKTLKSEEAYNIYEYINRQLKQQEQWIKRKGKGKLKV